MNPTFRIHFHSCIDSNNGSFDVTISRDLPFVPQIGMMIWGLRSEFDEFTVNEVSYDLIANYFEVSQATTRWCRRFTVRDACAFIEFGCRVDSFKNADEWANAQEQKGFSVQDNPE
jgi:hypothetical protein